MGILGLVQLVKEASYLEDYELRDTDLVIDGNCIFHLILDKWCRSIFGGDYDKFDQLVSDFFDHLLECNVKPLVLFQGGNYVSKISISLAKVRTRIQTALHASPENQENVKPLLSKYVFLQVLRKKDIPHAQCLFDSDNSIAAVAKALKCPILSMASYYYLYAVPYIPVDTLIDNVMNNLNGNKKMFPCKIYRLERLLNDYKGLNLHTLSLVSVLMTNNDSQLPQMVSNSLALIIRKNISGPERNKKCLIEILRWLCEHTLEEAVTEILKNTPTVTRPKLLSIIESSINKYTNPFAEVFTHLSIPEECFRNPTENLYRFKGNIEAFQAYNNKQTLRAVDQRENYITKMSNKLIATTQFDKDLQIDTLPQWFKREVSLAKFPATFVEIAQYQYHIFPIIVENFDHAPSCVIALPIYEILFKMLTGLSQNQTKVSKINYVIRNHNSFVINNILVTETVPLLAIRRLSLSDRKQFLLDILEIENMQFMEELLPEWHLYIASFKYWRANPLSKCDNCHMYAILTCMIYKLTVSKIGYYSSLESFEKSNTTLIKLLQKKRDKSNTKPKYSMIVTVAQACKEIDTLDCLLAAPFFIQHSEIKPDLSYGDKFDRNVLHAFGQFQFCLMASLDLNSLLDFPYQEPILANLYNGTLLYNLYTNFQMYADINAYKNIIFKNSPSLLRAFNALFILLEK